MSSSTTRVRGENSTPVAGGAVGGHPERMVFTANKTIVKKATQREIAFYQRMPDSLRPFCPRFIRIISEKEEEKKEQESAEGKSEGEDFSLPVLDLSKENNKEEDRSSAKKSSRGLLELEDVSAGCSLPCVMDVKVGFVHYEDDAPPEKVLYEQQKARESTTESLGFRLSGWTMSDEGADNSSNSNSAVTFSPSGAATSNSISSPISSSSSSTTTTVLSPSSSLCLARKTAMKITEKEMKSRIAQFFGRSDNDNNSNDENDDELRRDVIDVVRQRIREFVSWLSQNTAIHFRGSSLLIVYDRRRKSQEGREPSVHWIDFDHVQEGNEGERGIDQGVIKGLESFLQILDELMLEKQAK